MKLFSFTCFFAFFNLFLTEGKCEDTLIFLNGRTASGRVIDTTAESIQYLDIKSKKFNKVRTVDKERIFSIKYSSGNEVIFYNPDTIGEDDFSREEMRYFIYGEQDALKYRAPMATIGGIVTGAIAGPFIGGTAGLAFLLPGTYSILTGSRWIKINKSTVRNPQLLKEKAYLLGYERIARHKRVQNALKGSGLGLLLGVGAAFIIFDLD